MVVVEAIGTQAFLEYEEVEQSYLQYPTVSGSLRLLKLKKYDDPSISKQLHIFNIDVP